jgi:beta-fructofuranosidase
VLRLADAWVWDSWYLDTGEAFHAFYLKASRALVDKERRHHRASIGHAVSADLIEWTELPDALVRSDGPAFDDLATWTGSALVGPDGAYHMFYTGIGREHGDAVQRIGHAVSADLLAWTRVAGVPVCADPRWYSTLSPGRREHWRDPWVFRDDSAACWRMLVTAETIEPGPPAAGCIGTATSTDLLTWEVGPPLAVDTGFGQLEVTEVMRVDDSWVLVWCMRAADFVRSGEPADGGPAITGTWSAPADSPSGPFHLDRAEPIRVPGTYAGRVVKDRGGHPVLVAFADELPHGTFGGFLIDPVPLDLTERGTLQPSG